MDKLSTNRVYLQIKSTGNNKKEKLHYKTKNICNQIKKRLSNNSSNLREPSIYFLLLELWEMVDEYEKLPD